MTRDEAKKVVDEILKRYKDKHLNPSNDNELFEYHPDYVDFNSLRQEIYAVVDGLSDEIDALENDLFNEHYSHG